MKIKSNFISSINNCNKLFWYKIKLCIEDGFCDDIANTLACDYDGGDCCVEDPNTDYCVICDCIINDGNYCLFFTKRAQIIHQICFVSCIAGVTVSPDCFLSYLGDFYCDDINNFSHCNYDYGDCCLTGNSVHNYCVDCICKSNETSYPSTFGPPPPGPPPAGPPGQPQGQPPMYY